MSILTESPDWIARMLSGDKINSTKTRAALRGALRCDHPIMLDGEDIIPKIKQGIATNVTIHYGH